MTWTNVRDDCMLCKMEKKTHWYVETNLVVVADTLGPNPHPFVVLKDHTDEISTAAEMYAGGVVDALWPDRENSFDVRMGLVPDHWHAHVVFEDDNVDLSRE